MFTGKLLTKMDSRVPSESFGLILFSIFIKTNGSRTIVHHRGAMPEITFEDFKKLNLSEYSWIHFEGGFHSSTQSLIIKNL